MKKKKIVCIFIIIIIILIIVTIIVNIRKQKKSNQILKDIAEYYGCEYIKETMVHEKGYKEILYWNYDVPPVNTEEGVAYKEHYEDILKAISAQIKENYILKDDKNSIEIRIRYNRKNNKIIYQINNDRNFFENESQKAKAVLQEEMEKSEKTLNLNIKSMELQNTIENEWSRKKSEKNYGNKLKENNNYDIYSKGIKVKTVNSKIYNMIFSKEYKGEIFDNITTGMDNIKIREILGTPTYENTEANLLVGYKTEKYYVFFSNGEVSIYPVESFNEEKNNQFADIVFNYINNTSNYKETLQKITELYPDYSEYKQEENNIDLKYTLKGFEVKMGNGEKSGIYIYNNYNGFIIPKVKKENLKSEVINNVYIINSNLVFEEELKRISNP